MLRFNWGTVGLWALLLFMPAPIIVVIAASFSYDGYIRFPPGELSLRWYVEFLTDMRWLRALWTSLLLAVGGAMFSTTIAFLAALAIARHQSRFTRYFEVAIMTPLLFPQAALGIAMLALLMTFHVYGTFVGLLLAHCIITLPYAYRPISVSLRKLDAAMEEASMSLGAGRWYTFRHVTLPLVRPGIITTLLFSFILSFDEVTVTMFLVGPSITTLPLEIYSFIQESGTHVVAAISSVLVLITLLLVLILERVVGLEFFVEPDRR